ncbi:hypothetical protein GGQ61_000171 [Phenylobacterium haematophilum]|uniref:Uncharacterized protein n=1 Tax=Phenylobacterium haematophilum TaxID=98513 RepID=A0A839ZU17_9CAUL|nr:hypothetical protein [Phenylobacterium haematophilum]MBB3889474.1 hypothetical protein [Phenylobacterium haematophilum]
MSEAASEVRARAWATRRQKYGQRGHAGSYARFRPELVEQRALRLVVRLHQEGTLSEGQCCKALGLDRVEFRTICDAPAQPPGAEP